MQEWVQLVLSFVLGMTVGQFLRFERILRGKRAFLRPRISWPSLDNRWVTLILVVMFVGSAAQITWWTFHQRQCNEQFQGTTIQLRRISDEDRELERQDDDLRNQRDDAMTTLLSGLLNPPAGGRPDSLGLLNQIYATNRAIDFKRDELLTKRSDLERQRRAQVLPSQRC